jgi:hypothetical protein
MKQKIEIDTYKQVNSELNQDSTIIPPYNEDDDIEIPVICRSNDVIPPYNEEDDEAPAEEVYPNTYEFLKCYFIARVFTEAVKGKEVEMKADCANVGEQETLEIRKRMAKIQSKENINVKEFAEIYGISKSAQQGYRGRIHNPLIGYQPGGVGGKISYKVKEIEAWLYNNNQQRRR